MSTLRQSQERTGKKKVFVAMSGGVDSSVAALLLKQATPDNFERLFGRPTPKGFRGYDCVGVFMKCWSGGGPDATVGVQCAWERDAEDARRVANVLGIPFYTFDFEEAYKQKVVEYLLEGYRQGITPNPDVVCNREIKFGLFFKKALSMGADYVATGHYIKLMATPTRGAVGAPTSSVGAGHYVRVKQKTIDSKQKTHSLYAAQDTNKDQSYFLWTLTQRELAHCLFPIGDYLKSEVRELARKANLPTAEKKDSQGICFLGDVDVFDFLRKRIKEKRGDIITADGKKVGEHRGAWFYTIGQRHGLDIREPGKLLRRHGAHETKPFYVAGKDIPKNLIIVAEGNDAPELFRREVVLANVNFINEHEKIEGQTKVFARVRYRQPLVPATLTQLETKNSRPKTRTEDSGDSSIVYRLRFSVPIKFVAPGQSAVFYARNGEVLGGGVIV